MGEDDRISKEDPRDPRAGNQVATGGGQDYSVKAYIPDLGLGEARIDAEGAKLYDPDGRVCGEVLRVDATQDGIYVTARLDDGTYRRLEDPLARLGGLKVSIDRVGASTRDQEYRIALQATAYRAANDRIGVEGLAPRRTDDRVR